MYTIIDYLKFYKDITIDKVHWNDMDNLMCSIIAYLPIESFNNIKNMGLFYDYSIKYKDKKLESVMVPKAYEVLELIKDSKRYSNLKISNWINLKNDSTQFGALTIRINNNTIISYKGTDGSLIGWIENFRLGYIYPTNTHVLAINYLNRNVSFNDKNVFVVGHSKGGNLAMVSALESNNKIFSKINKVYNFDGPGFTKEIFNSEKYVRLSKKLLNIVPTGSVVGTILYNKDYKVVKSSNIAFNEHYPTSWNTFGECFIEGKLSKISMQVNESTTKKIENISYDKLNNSFETIFNNLGKEYSSDFNLTFDDIIKFYKNMRKVDPEISKYIDIIMNSMINAHYVEKGVKE